MSTIEPTDDEIIDDEDIDDTEGHMSQPPREGEGEDDVNVRF